MDTSRIAPPLVTLRIPGMWENREQFERSLPDGFQLQPEGDRLVTPEGEVQFGVAEADDALAQLIVDGSKSPPSEHDRHILDNHFVKVFLSGEVGSVEAASRMVRIGAGIVRAAGGGGVFVDNSGVAHSSGDWVDLADSIGNGGEYWAYLATTRGKKDMWTNGMHVLGYRDAVIMRSDDEELDFLLIHNFLGYSYRSGRTIHDGDVFGDPFSPWFRAHAESNTMVPADSPMHNPYGLWRLEMIEPDEDVTPISMRN